MDQQPWQGNIFQLRNIQLYGQLMTVQIHQHGTIYVSVTDTEDPTYTQPTGVDSSFAYNRTTDPGKCYYTVPGTGFDLQNLDDNC